MSQCDSILADFQRGNALTHLDARDRHSCLRLAARVGDLKKLGHDIRKKMIQVKSGKWVALYWLELPKGQLALFDAGNPARTPANRAPMGAAPPSADRARAFQ